MKKSLRIIAIMTLVFVMATGVCMADTAGRMIHLTVGKDLATVNGQDVKMAAAAQVVSGRTLVPLRFVSEAFGCQVDWVSETKTAVVTLENQVIEVPIGQNHVVINGDLTEVEVPGQLIGGSTFVPLRFIGENLGATVEYDAPTKGITITLPTYNSEAYAISAITPDGWTVTEDAKKGIITFVNGDHYAIAFGPVLEDTTQEEFAGIVANTFENHNSLDWEIQDNGITATSDAYLDEDGMLKILGMKLIDKTLWSFALATDITDPNELDEAVINQMDIILNTFSGATAK